MYVSNIVLVWEIVRCRCTVLNKQIYEREREKESMQARENVRRLFVYAMQWIKYFRYHHPPTNRFSPPISDCFSLSLSPSFSLSFRYVILSLFFRRTEREGEKFSLSLRGENGLRDRTVSTLHLSYKHTSTSEAKRF